MPFPHKDEIFKFIRESATPQTKREIVRAFAIHGDDRKKLKSILRELEEYGKIIKGPGQAYSVPNTLPEVCVLQITYIDLDGNVFAAPQDWDKSSQGKPPRIELLSNAPVKEGDNVLAKLKKYNEKLYEASLIRRLDRTRATVMGQVVKNDRGRFILEPTHKKAKYNFDIDQKDLNGAKIGDLAIGEVISARGLHRKKVKIIDVIVRSYF